MEMAIVAAICKSDRKPDLSLVNTEDLPFKYYHDTLVENKSRGNAFWFQVAVPFSKLSRRTTGI